MLKKGFKYCGRPLLLDRVCRDHTPLHRSHDKDTCDILLKNGADVNAKTDL